ncbi:MAG: JAB domain-containing protein [Candidatus Riflebacteria bacterium]|nr:JAB domain-containing protein [Candidatus Riflebacteria bacterium]
MLLVRDSGAVAVQAPLRGPGDARECFTRSGIDLSSEAVETLWAIVLDCRMRMIALTQIARGTLTTCPTSARSIAQVVLAANGTAVILAHNHPSGDPTPSAEDVEATRRVKEALAAIEIALLDHIVVGDDRSISMREAGLF